MNKEVDEIINKIECLTEIKQMKKLRDKLNKNTTYLSLMSEFEKNKNEYIKNNELDKKISELRLKLFEIDELKEYLLVQNKLRILSMNINNILLSVIDKKSC